MNIDSVVNISLVHTHIPNGVIGLARLYKGYK